MKSKRVVARRLAMFEAIRGGEEEGVRRWIEERVWVGDGDV